MKINWNDPATIPTGPVALVCSLGKDRIAFEGTFAPSPDGAGYRATGFALLLCGLYFAARIDAVIEIEFVRGVGPVVGFYGKTKVASWKPIEPEFLTGCGLVAKHLEALAIEVRRGDCFIEAPLLMKPTAESAEAHDGDGSASP